MKYFSTIALVAIFFIAGIDLSAQESEQTTTAKDR